MLAAQQYGGHTSVRDGDTADTLGLATIDGLAHAAGAVSTWIKVPVWAMQSTVARVGRPNSTGSAFLM